ncbi:hypothetical protein N2152v2_007799 [Parachlorella kessleri]
MASEKEYSKQEGRQQKQKRRKLAANKLADDEATPALRRTAAVSEEQQQQQQREDPQEPTGWEELERVEAPGDAAPAATEPEQKKLSKHAKKRLKEDKEKAIMQAELKRLEGDAAPTSITEFEQLVMSSPNSSYVWIKYLAFLISLGDIDKARALADRALQTINYREEGERFNVWVALLNLENLYGSEEATLGLLGRALSHTDPRRMYLAALDIFDRTGKEGLAEQCLKAMCRKFSENVEVWLRTVKYRLAKDDSEGARKALERSLQALPKFEHIRMISQAGLLEFKLGDPERGRSLFEGVLRNYPKRLDLWSVYLDQEIAAGEQQRIRALFERATHLQLPPKKMKFLVKRYLEYEKKEGTAATVEHVKRRALEFVEQHAVGAA